MGINSTHSPFFMPMSPFCAITLSGCSSASMRALQWRVIHLHLLVDRSGRNPMSFAHRSNDIGHGFVEPVLTRSLAVQTAIVVFPVPARLSLKIISLPGFQMASLNSLCLSSHQRP